MESIRARCRPPTRTGVRAGTRMPRPHLRGGAAQRFESNMALSADGAGSQSAILVPDGPEPERRRGHRLRPEHSGQFERGHDLPALTVGVEHDVTAQLRVGTCQ